MGYHKVVNINQYRKANADDLLEVIEPLSSTDILRLLNDMLYRIGTEHFGMPISPQFELAKKAIASPEPQGLLLIAAAALEVLIRRQTAN